MYSNLALNSELKNGDFEAKLIHVTTCIACHI